MNTKKFELEQVLTIMELAKTNHELTSLLFATAATPRRNEIIEPLRHPKQFLYNLKELIAIVSQKLEAISTYAQKSYIDVPQRDIEIKCWQDASIHIFHSFDCEDISIIENCYFLSTKHAKKAIINPAVAFPYAINLLLALKEDILVSIVRFEEYLQQFPTEKLRNEHIQDYFINENYV